MPTHRSESITGRAIGARSETPPIGGANGTNQPRPKNLAWRGRNDRVASFLPRTQRKGEYALRRGTGRIIAATAPVRARIDASPKRRRRSVPGQIRRAHV